MTCMLKAHDPKASTTQCGRTAPHAEASIWWTNVDCPACLRYLADHGHPVDQVTQAATAPSG